VTDFVRKNHLAEKIFIFEAFDESEKPGADTERHFGVMVGISTFEIQESIL
jgi:hypothetical protein